MERTYYPTLKLMQLAAKALSNPNPFTDADKEWLAGQLDQRAAAVNDGLAY